MTERKSHVARIIEILERDGQISRNQCLSMFPASTRLGALSENEEAVRDLRRTVFSSQCQLIAVPAGDDAEAAAVMLSCPYPARRLHCPVPPDQAVRAALAARNQARRLPSSRSQGRRSRALYSRPGNDLT